MIVMDKSGNVSGSAAGRLCPGYDYVLVGRRAALELPFDRLVEEFNGALLRLEMTAAKDMARRSAVRPTQAPSDTSH